LTVWKERKKGRKERNKIEEDGFHKKGENLDLSQQDTPVKRERESYL
jgi:hypothetical protein